MQKFIIIFSLLVMIGCKKDKNEKYFNDDLLKGRCRVWCDVKGAVSSNYQSDDYYSFSAYNLTQMSLAGVYINNSTSIREDVTLSFPVSITAGSYNLSSSLSPNITFTYLKKNVYAYDDKIWTAGIGSYFTVNITKVSYTEIEGTFVGAATNSVDGTTINVTNGKFRTEFSH